MYPEIFHLHFSQRSFPIIGNELVLHSYGLMMVIAFLACQWLASRLAKRHGFNPEIFVNATLIALVTGVIGCRLSHILENLGDYTRSDLTAWQNFKAMINIPSGGLTFYGGLILAAPVVMIYMVRKKVPIRTAMDLCAPCITLGLAIGRIGCFLNGCCYGATCSLPWAVQFPYDSNAYVDQFYRTAGDRLNHPVPSELTMQMSDGSTRLLKPGRTRQGPATARAGENGKIKSRPPGAAI